MLGNLLRILIMKQTISTMRAESARQLAELKQMQEQPVPQITNKEELEAYLKQIEQREKERVRYCSRPIMALETAANVNAFYPILVLMGIAIFIGAILLVYYGLPIYGVGESLLQGAEVVIYGAGIIVIPRYIQHYLENTMCLFYADRICIKKYRKKDIVITYDEIKECTRDKKVKIHNGRFEFPYKGGCIYIYTFPSDSCGCVPDRFYKFMNDKCGLRMPRIGKRERDVVRRTGIGWAFYSYMGIPLYIVGVVMMFTACTFEYGFNLDTGFWETYTDYLLSTDNFFGVLAIIFIVPGIIAKFCFYFPAKKHFAKYKDTIKVSLF